MVLGEEWVLRDSLRACNYLKAEFPLENVPVFEELLKRFQRGNRIEVQGSKFELDVYSSLRKELRKVCLLERPIPNCSRHVDISFRNINLQLELVSWKSNALSYGFIRDPFDEAHVLQELNKGFNYSSNDFMDTQGIKLAGLCEKKAEYKNLHHLSNPWLLADLTSSDVFENYSGRTEEELRRGILDEFNKAAKSYLDAHPKIGVAARITRRSRTHHEVLLIREGSSSFDTLSGLFGKDVGFVRAF